MTHLDHPVIHVIGANLCHERRARNMSQRRAGELLGVTGDWINDVETGRRHGSGPGLRALCRLYGMPAEALLSLAAADPSLDVQRSSQSGHSDGARCDRAQGSTGRLTAALRESSRVRFLTIALIPPPLRPPASVRKRGAPAPRHVRTWPDPRPADVFVLTERLVRSASSAQVDHLLALRGKGSVSIHVRAQTRLPRLSRIVELELPGGTVIGSGHRPIAYQATTKLSDLIDVVLAGPGHDQDLLRHATPRRRPT
ncbi:helix-turn-helix domain-containing protein [Streptomyces sp. NPDC055089]